MGQITVEKDLGGKFKIVKSEIEGVFTVEPTVF